MGPPCVNMLTQLLSVRLEGAMDLRCTILCELGECEYGVNSDGRATLA
jgi:hypothetical protein